MLNISCSSLNCFSTPVLWSKRVDFCVRDVTFVIPMKIHLNLAKF